MDLVAVSNKQAASHAETEPMDSRVCEYTLRKVFSWLDVPDLLCGAALVSQRWAAAAACKEVWRRRMHLKVLNTLFNPQHTNQQQDDLNNNNTDNTSDVDSSSSNSSADQEQSEEQQQQQDATAAAIAAMAAVRMTPARLFAALYGTSLLLNGSFLERLNSHKGANRRLVWEPTFNVRGMTWAHPFDFFPELCPLPEDQGSVGAPLKPFSIGCLATSSGAWSEVVQVVSLQPLLEGGGVPPDTAAWLVNTAGLTMEFSVMVAGGAAAGGEYQVVMTLVSAADAATAANNDIPLSGLPTMSLPFGHPPAGCPGIEAVSAAQLKARGFGQGTRNIAKAPLHPAPGVWTRYSCRTVLPRDTHISHVVIALRGRASRNSRLGHYATKFADARLKFVTADEC